MWNGIYFIRVHHNYSFYGYLIITDASSKKWRLHYLIITEEQSILKPYTIHGIPWHNKFKSIEVDVYDQNWYKSSQQYKHIFLQIILL